MSVSQLINVTRQFARHQLPLNDLPQYVFLVGAQKAGTSALYSYLLQHPMIIGGDQKELGFFNNDFMFGKGINHFRSQFPAWPKGTHALDATPGYMYYSNSAERIHAFRSDAKIIMVLREPVSRAFSAFNMYQQTIKDKWFRRMLQNANVDARAFFTPLVEKKIKPSIQYFLDTEMAIIKGEAEGEEPALIRRGIYAPQLDRFIRLFGRDNVLVLFSNDLKREPERVTNEVFRFIGLESLTGGRYPLKHVRDYSVDNSGKEAIQECAGALFEKDKAELINRYGLNVPW